MAPSALNDCDELLLKLYRLSSELSVEAFQDAALGLIKAGDAPHLAPHVMQALSLNRAMRLDALGPVPAIQRGAAIADLRGVLYHADPFFHEMLRAEWQAVAAGRLPEPLRQCFLAGNARYLGALLVADHHVEQGLLFIKVRERCRADALSPRELMVARRAARGETHKQIAQALDRSPATIRNQIQSIYEKLEVGNVAGLVKQLALAGWPGPATQRRERPSNA